MAVLMNRRDGRASGHWSAGCGHGRHAELRGANLQCNIVARQLRIAQAAGSRQRTIEVAGHSVLGERAEPLGTVGAVPLHSGARAHAALHKQLVLSVACGAVEGVCGGRVAVWRRVLCAATGQHRLIAKRHDVYCSARVLESTLLCVAWAASRGCGQQRRCCKSTAGKAWHRNPEQT